MQAMQLVNRASKLLLLFLIAFSQYGCEDDNGNNEDGNFSRDDYVGTWTCREISGPFAPQVYDVIMEAGTASDELVLRGLANQGVDFAVRARIVNQGFNIPLQTVDGLSITCTAATSGSISPTDLVFDLDDGSGESTTEAELTR